MNQLYTLNDVKKSNNQKATWLAIYIAVISIFVAGIVAILVIYANEPYGTEKKTPLMITLIVLAGVAVILSFLFFILVFGPIHRYNHYLKYTVFGKRKTSSVTVIDVFYQPNDFRGLDFYTLSVLEWSDVRKDFLERNILVDAEITSLDLAPDDIVTVETCANCLLAYQKVNND